VVKLHWLLAHFHLLLLKKLSKNFQLNIQQQPWLVMMLFHNMPRKANQISLGSPIIPSINFDKADVIVGFNTDFLGTGISNIENAKKYIANRIPTKENPKMSRHHQFQSTMTITGATADYRYPIKPSEEKQALN
jgi:hypothetical protein